MNDHSLCERSTQRPYSPQHHGCHTHSHSSGIVVVQGPRNEVIADLGVPGPCAAYGNYEELVADANVDVLYVATPHSHHFQNVMLAFEAGKNVLCEKAFTVNAAQTKILCETARKKNLFLMEAVWTRYFPLSIQVRDLIKDGAIGEVLRVAADNSFGDDVEETWGTKHRMVNKDLAGGCLLDRKFPLSLSFSVRGT